MSCSIRIYYGEISLVKCGYYDEFINKKTEQISGADVGTGALFE